MAGRSQSIIDSFGRMSWKNEATFLEALNSCKVRRGSFRCLRSGAAVLAIASSALGYFGKGVWVPAILVPIILAPRQRISKSKIFKSESQNGVFIVLNAIVYVSKQLENSKRDERKNSED
uniref:Uncharacterized protein n=1 Tax=Romanomermis culicivorax TaxID=13658 RepID=A0A915JNL3_ROMCU